MINGIVLAAGQSRRMGRPKALLPFGRETFLGHIISVLKCCDLEQVTVVLGADAETIKESVDLSKVTVAVNEDYKRGQLSSLIVGLNTAPVQAKAVLVCLVDMPFITDRTVKSIVLAFREQDVPIVIPVFEGRRGHPVLFGKSVFDELQHAPLDEGARHVVHAEPGRVLEVEVPDEGILMTINTPEQYRRHVGNRPLSPGSTRSAG
jgi:molybdenum cofactor cytidylyltransferase